MRGAALAPRRRMMRSIGLLTTLLAFGCSGAATDLSARGDHVDDCRVGGTEESCVTAGGDVGVAACQDNKTASACGVVGECHPGELSKVCPNSPCKLMGDTWAFGPCGNGGGS